MCYKRGIVFHCTHRVLLHYAPKSYCLCGEYTNLAKSRVTRLGIIFEPVNNIAGQNSYGLLPRRSCWGIRKLASVLDLLLSLICSSLLNWFIPSFTDIIRFVSTQATTLDFTNISDFSKENQSLLFFYIKEFEF